MFGDFKDGDRGSMLRFGRGQLPEGGGVPSIGSRGFYDLGGVYGHKPPPEILPHNPTDEDQDRFLAAVNGPPEVPAMKERTLPPALGTTRSTILIDGELILDLGGGRALVYSKSNPGHWHEILNDTCSCDGFAKWDKVCRHLRAARQLHDGTDRVGMLEIPQRKYDEAMAAPSIHEERLLPPIDGKTHVHDAERPMPHIQDAERPTPMPTARLPVCPECHQRPVAVVLGVPAKMCGRCALTPMGLE